MAAILWASGPAHADRCPGPLGLVRLPALPARGPATLAAALAHPRHTGPAGLPGVFLLGRPAPGTRWSHRRKKPLTLSHQGLYVRWWSCVNQNYTFYTINSTCYIFIKIGIPTKIPTFYFRTLEQEAPLCPFSSPCMASEEIHGKEKGFFEIALCYHLRNHPPICWITRGPESDSGPASRLGRYRADVC